MTAEVSLILISLIEEAMKIEDHLKILNETKISHYKLVQEMHHSLLQSKAMKFDRKYIPRYHSIFKRFIETL